MDQSEPEKMRCAGGTEQNWCRAVPGGTGVTVLLISFSIRPDPSLLLSALHKIQNSHPILRAKLCSAAGPPSYSVSTSSYIRIEDVDAISTSEILASGAGTASPFHRLVEHEMNRNPWAAVQADQEDPRAAEAATHLMFATTYAVPGPPESSVVALRLHTSVCDRTSGSSVIRELLDLLLEGENGSVERRGLMPALEEMILPEKAAKPFWARGKDMLGYSLNFTRSAWLPFQDAAGARSSEVVMLELTVEETNMLLSACKSKGFKLCSALTAAALIAAISSKHLGQNRSETYTVITLIDCRRSLDPTLDNHDLGFYYSAIQNAHSVHGGEDLWELSGRCHSTLSTAMHNNKHLTDIADLNFLMCRAIENPILTPSSSLRTALVSVFHEPIDYGSGEPYQQAGVRDLVGCASAHGVGPSIAVFDSIRGGRLGCAFVHPSPLHSREQMGELVGHVKRLLVGGGDAREDQL